MNVKTCPTCGNEISADVVRCQHCGSLLMSLGKTGVRSIKRTNALVLAIILLLFPLCCLVTAGYRIWNDGQPADYQAWFGGEETEEPVVVSEGDGTPSDTPLPSDTPQQADTEVPSPDDPIVDPTVTQSANALAECIPDNAQRQVGEVIQVIDGDEIRVRVEGDEYIVRYIGIVAPNIAETFGPEASNENVILVLTKQVTLVRDVTDQDSDGVLPRYVFVGDVFVNQHMVRNGFALAENQPPDVACSALLQSEEATAQSEQRGRWEATPEPTNTLAPLWTSTPDGSGNGGGGENPNCNCNGPDLDCDDFENDTEAELCYLKCIWHGDVFDLDPDENGVACD